MASKCKNTGTDNTGENNTGNRNSGHWNSGHWNSGNGNSGNRNSGNRNSGHWNSGNWNSGNWNSGIWNSGDRNSGHWNSGNWNSGDRNSGIFNTDEPYMRAFNKETKIKRSEFNAWPDFSDMNPCVWVESSIMTEKEKKDNPTHTTTGGYLKVLSYKEAWAVWKRKCTPENWQKVLALPNFDKDIFFEITGIAVDEPSIGKTVKIKLAGGEIISGQIVE